MKTRFSTLRTLLWMQTNGEWKINPAEQHLLIAHLGIKSRNLIGAQFSLYKFCYLPKVLYSNLGIYWILKWIFKLKYIIYIELFYVYKPIKWLSLNMEWKSAMPFFLLLCLLFSPSPYSFLLFFSIPIFIHFYL